MPKFFKLLNLQLVRIKRRSLLWTKRNLRRIPWQKLSWEKLKWPILICSALVVGILSIFLISKLPPRAPSFKKNSNGDYVFEAKNKVFQSKLGLKEQKPLISFGVDDNKAITLIYQNTENDQPSLENQGKTLTFNEVEPGLQIQYQTLPNGIKEEIVLHQKRQKTKDANVFLFEANLENAFVKGPTKGFSGPIFYDQYNQYLFHFEKPFAIDAAGNRTDNASLQIENKNDSKVPVIKNSINGETPYVVRLTVDEAWLNDPARVYPITIDPTIVHDTSAEFTVGQLNRVKDLGSGSAPQLESYYQELSADPYTIGLWHMNETSGTSVADSSGNGNNGTVNGTTIVDGLFGKARSFTGVADKSTTPDYIDIPNLAFSATDKWTVATWIKTSCAHSMTIVGDNTTTHPGLGFTTSGTIRFRDTAAVYVTSSATNICNNQWHHIAYVADGSMMNIYFDG